MELTKNLLSSPLRAPERKENLADVLFSLAIALALFSLISVNIRLWDYQTGFFIGSYANGLLISTVVLFVALYLNHWTIRGLRCVPYGFALCLVLVFFSDWFSRPYSFLPGKSIRGEILLGALLSFFAATHAPRLFFRLAIVSAIGICGWCFFEEAGGRLLYTDDHAAVFYRLQLLKDHFPNIPVYNPLWNAGLDVRDFFPTGILNLFFLTFPLIYAFDLESVYNLIIIVAVFVFVPLFTYIAGRKENLPSPVPAIAALLSITSSLLWYRWCFKYGAMGYIVSSSLVPLSITMVSRIMSREEELTTRDIVVSLFCLTLMVFWPAAVIVFIPQILACGFFARKLLKKKRFVLLLVALLLVNLPWMIVFASASNLWAFVKGAHHNSSTESQDPQHADLQRRMFPAKKGSFRIAGTVQRFQENSSKGNPLLLFLAIPGFFLFPRRSSAVAYAGTSLWLLLASCAFSPLVPQFELERLFITLLVILPLPSALALWSLFSEARSRARLMLGHFSTGFLLSGVFATTWFLDNRSVERYFFEGPVPKELVTTIQRFGGTGRTLFSGFILHEFEHAHIAPLAKWSNRPLVASSPIHNIWRKIDVVPTALIKEGEKGIEGYFDLLNVSAVVTHVRKWKEYCETRPDKYLRVWENGRFRFYQRRQYTPNYFYQGSGEIVSQDTGSFTFRPNLAEGIIKFRYFPFLTSSQCELGPAEFPGEVVLIAFRNCPVGSEVTVRARSGLARVFFE